MAMKWSSTLKDVFILEKKRQTDKGITSPTSRQPYEQPEVEEIGQMGELVQFGWAGSSDFVSRGHC